MAEMLFSFRSDYSAELRANYQTVEKTAEDGAPRIFNQLAFRPLRLEARVGIERISPSTSHSKSSV